MRKPKQPLRAKLTGGKVQKISKIRGKETFSSWKTMKLKSSRASRLLKTLPKELKVLFFVLKPGTTIDMVRNSCCQASTKLLQATYWSIFFLEHETQEKIALERTMNHRSWALIYRNGLRRYFLERKDGESFDIGEDKDLKKKLAAEEKQLKAEGKGNRPHRAAPFDENQVEELSTTGAVGLKTPRQLLHLVCVGNK